MKKTIIKIEKQQKYLMIKSLLTENGCNFIENKITHTAFPVLNDVRKFGELIIEGELGENLLKEIEKLAIVEIEEE